MKRYFFYKLILPVTIWLSSFFNKRKHLLILRKIVDLNNNLVLNDRKTGNKKILLLLPRCLQYFDCNCNIISSISNCRSCGKCKIKEIISLNEKYNLEIKVVPGGNLAKMFVKETDPGYIIAVACDVELILGIKEVYPYKVLAVSNIIVDKPCINTDVKVENIEYFLQKIAR
ncbi:MAG: DUF116 domain-containing protein [Endomicrobiia bacterium]